MRSAITRLAILFAALCVAASLFGQAVTSSITGTVADVSGAVIPGATVTVSDRAQGFTRVTKTNGAGSYLVAAMPAGTYTLTVTAKGFKTYVASGIIVLASQKIRADAKLQVGAVSTQVTVQGAAIGQVHTQDAQLGGTITGKQITQLELNGRNFTQLITLIPGVNNQTGQEEGTVGVYGSVAYSVNGGRTEYNNWEVDGVSILDTGSNGTINVYPSVDAIAETRVLTSNYGAQYGQNASGAVVAVLKSGTSQFHGDVYEFNRNEIFNARSFFDTGNPAYKKNDWGYTFGGPFYIPGHYNTNKTKTFFFWSQEWRREEDPSTFVNQVPSNLERGGNFSDVCPGSGSPVNTTLFPDCPMNPATGTYFPGNIVPIDPNAKAEMAMIPAPNFGTGAESYYDATDSFPTDWSENLVRVDQNMGSKMRLMVHYIHDSWSTVTPTTLWSTGSFPTINTDFGGPGTSFVTQLTQNLSPTLLNETILGYTADHIILNNTGTWQRPSSMTMTGLFDNGFGGKLSGISICCNSAYGGGFGEDPGFIDPAAPNYNANPIYTLRDMVSKISGNHNLTFGADYIAYEKNEQGGGETQGFLTFSSTDSAISTGNGFADFLLGRIANYSQNNLTSKYYNRYKILSPYFQDDWHVTRKLTANLGLRIEGYGTFWDRYHDEYSFEQSAYNPADAPEIDVTGAITGQAGALVPGVGNPYDGMVQCGVGGAPPGCIKGHWFNPAPRLGLAWDPFGHGTTAIRAGYSIFYDHTNGNEADSESLEGSPPYVLDPTVYNINGYENIPSASGSSALLFPLAVTSIEPQIYWPYMQQWNLDVQHSLGKDTVLTVAYVGSKGTHLTDQRDLNQLEPTPASQNPFPAGQGLTSAICSNLTVNGSPTGTPVTGHALTNLNVACGNVDPDPYRPITGLGDLTFLETEANSDYNSLQVYLRKTIGRLNLSTAYTYEHSLDDSSDRYDGTFVNSYDLKQNYATSTFDETHILSGSYVYNLPTLHNVNALVRDTVGGWELTGIVSINSGTPFSVTNGAYPDSAGVANGIGTGSYASLCGNPYAAPPSYVNPGNIVGPTLLNPSAFCQPTALTFGNETRDGFRNPTEEDWDTGIMKNFPIHGERANVQFRAEVFNVLNTVRWTGTNSGISCYGANFNASASSCLGTYDLFNPSGAGLGRIFQFALKFSF